jgi:SsrA-binding protein
LTSEEGVPILGAKEAMDDSGIKVLAVNRKARFNYSIEESFECGIELRGTEVKSVKTGHISFPDAFAEVKRGEVWVRNLHISEYAFSSLFNHDPDREKRLLLHKQEIKRLQKKVDEKGFTLVPIRFYLKKGRIKVELALCKGKKLFDKRDDIKTRETERDMRRELRNRGR